MDSPNQDVQDPDACQPEGSRTDKIEDHPTAAAAAASAVRAVQPVEDPGDDVDEGKHEGEVLEGTGGWDEGDDLDLDMCEETGDEDEERGGVEVLEVGEDLGDGCELMFWVGVGVGVAVSAVERRREGAYGCHSMASLRGVHH